MGGVQRNFWWKVDLPGAPGVTAHFSPLFDAMWVASDPQHICKPADVSTDSARAHGKHRLYGARPDRVHLLATSASAAAHDVPSWAAARTRTKACNKCSKPHGASILRAPVVFSN